MDLSHTSSKSSEHWDLQVRMVTGDNLHTASHIASECGILQPGGLVLAGPDFRKLPESKLQQLLPRLQVCGLLQRQTLQL